MSAVAATLDNTAVVVRDADEDDAELYEDSGAYGGGGDGDAGAAGGGGSPTRSSNDGDGDEGDDTGQTFLTGVDAGGDDGDGDDDGEGERGGSADAPLGAATASAAQYLDDAYEFEPSQNVSESTRLHKKLREMKEVDARLAATKEEYAARIRVVKKGEARFLEKQRNTIEYLRKFKAFIVETDAKRSRAQQKAGEERRQIAARSTDLAALRNLLKTKQRERNVKEREFARICQYQEYLDRVLTANEQYTEVDELLTRHTILDDMNRDLRAESAQVAARMERYQTDLQTLLKQKQNDVLVQNSVLARMMKELEDVSNEGALVESQVQALEVKALDASRRFGEVQLAIRNIHARAMSAPSSRRKRSQTMLAAQSELAMQQQGISPWAAHNNRKQRTPEEIEEAKSRALVSELSALLSQCAERVRDMLYIAEVAGGSNGLAPHKRGRRGRQQQRDTAQSTSPQQQQQATAPGDGDSRGGSGYFN